MQLRGWDGRFYYAELPPFRAALIEISVPERAEPVLTNCRYEVITEEKDGTPAEEGDNCHNLGHKQQVEQPFRDVVLFDVAIDDNKDAKWIADLFKLGIVRSSFIPNKDIRILRELTRYLYKLTNMRSSEKNRFTNALTVGNCKLDMVFSDIFGKTSSAIINTILSQNEYEDKDILQKVHGHCKASCEDILNSISGISWEESQKQRINIIQSHIEYLNTQIKQVKEIINSLVKPYESAITLLCSIPGIERDSAIKIISEIGTDMSQFSSHYRLASWAGLAPGCNESAGKKKSVKISRAGVYLKPYLVEVAHNAVKDKTNSYYAKKFEKISKRRGKKRTYIAIARKILVAIYHMFETGEVWNPVDLASVETPVTDRIKYTKNNFNQSLKQLLSLGLTSEELIDLINQNANKLPV